MREVVLRLSEPFAVPEFPCRELPGSFAGLGQEYEALVSFAGLLPAPWEMLVEIGGEERTGFLQSLLTADVASLPVGHCLPAAQADRRGRWIADLRVLALADRYWLRVRRDRWPVLAALFDHQRVSERVAWHEVEQAETAFLLCGPEAARLWREAAPGREGEFDHGGTILWRGIPVRWMKVREVSAGDLLFFLPRAGRQDFLRAWGAGEFSAMPGEDTALMDSRAFPMLPISEMAPVPPVLLCGWDAFNLRRIEVGPAWFGLDGGEDRLVAEALPGDRISWNKGCYLGQETLARLRGRGKLNWRLGRLRCDTLALCPPGTELRDASGSRSGWVTSVAHHPGGGMRLLGYVHTRAVGADAVFHLPEGDPVSLEELAAGGGESA